MNLNDVRLFLRVVETNSFTAAADTLGIQKSTISRRIAQLEDDLGVRLLQRSTRKLSLTDEGQELFDRCRPLVEELEQVPDLVAANQHDPRGKLRITVPTEMGIYMLDEVVAGFLIRYPKLDVDIELSTRVVDLIEEGYDLALRVGDLADSSLIARPISSITLGLFASPAYLEQYGVPATPADLPDHLCITIQRPNPSWSFDNWENGAQIPVSGRVRANSLSFAASMAEKGLGIARLPRPFSAGMVEQGSLVPVLEEYKANQVTINAVYPSRRHLNPKVRLFIDYVKEMIQDHPWMAD
ncbi:LysR family transcriptional regulator [Marinobacterium jannaschii]|uniref:LysR family transcriptional regulator n=1 Tax=Marinobacterium jannaschii TaxID=64970 RepID=UPI00048849BD|nr:LysR family transcriptional regulator [Marinobacterium jannaschii]